LDDPNIDRDGHQKVDLYISCRGLKDTDVLSKSDPQVIVYLSGVEIGKTEVVRDNLNPDFKKSFSVNYIFEKKQPMIFKVIDVDKDGKYNDLGTIETTLGHIMGAKQQIALFELTVKGKKAGKLIVKSDVLQTSRGTLDLQFGAKIPS